MVTTDIPTIAWEITASFRICNSPLFKCLKKIGTAARREATVPTTGVTTHEAIADTFTEPVNSASTTCCASNSIQKACTGSLMFLTYCLPNATKL
jgi:hypothetical protein